MGARDLVAAEQIILRHQRSPDQSLLLKANAICRDHGNILREIRSGGLISVLEDVYEPVEPNDYLEVMRRWAGGAVAPFIDKWAKSIERAHVLVRIGGTPSDRSWNPYRATHYFTAALTNLMLPDLAELPIDLVAELRSKLQPTLDPMRADLLRLTEDLRKAVVRSDPSEEEVFREARSLIKTRVEPAVREAGFKAREMMTKRRRKFLVGMAKSFGFAGAGFIYPDLIRDALKEAVSAGTAIVSDDSSPPPLATARFVLEARRLINR